MHALLPSVEDVFSDSGKGDKTSGQVALCHSRLSSTPFANETANDDSRRAPTVRRQDIPIVLQKMSKIFDSSREGSAADSTNPDTSAVVFDVDALRASFAAAKDAYPPHFVHCMAVKCCPLSFVVQVLLEEGFGVEAASFVELYMGLAHGCPPELAVFDSPAKTDEELTLALSKGVLVNVNSLDELDRIESILQGRMAKSELDKSEQSPIVAPRVGIRLNPLVGFGAIAELSTAVPTSKFGVPATPENLRAVLEAFRKWPWVVGLHSHVGSQGCSLEQLTQGASVISNVADMVDAELGKGRVAVLDIGGGLPANYLSDEVSPTFQDHAAALMKAAPQLFENTERQVITEFGRAMVAKMAFTVSKVEYVRDNPFSGNSQSGEASSADTGSDARATQDDSHQNEPCEASTPPTCGGDQTLVIHVGADMFVRTAYRPQSFQHRFSLYGTEGEELSRPLCRTEVAGPLCFQGDYVVKGAELPRASDGDLLVIHDTGANTFALFSRHCSRPTPAVYGYSMEKNGDLSLKMMKKKESIEEVARFWGPPVVV